ncbi:uncharacterized protein LOC104266326 isoform X2 [Ciona intestinalis]
MGSSPEPSTPSNDDTSHPSISEPQPNVSSQDVSIPAPNSTQFESSSKCWIGSSEGKLEVGGCELVVPPGALEEDVEIKLTASLPLESEYLETPTLQCEPASLTFKEQVTIKLQTHVVLDKETIRRCKLLHSEDGIKWEEIETKLKFSDNFISFQTDHFSWWKVIFIITILQDGVYEPSCEVYLNSLLYQKPGAVVWKVCWNLDVATRENELKEHHFAQETWTIPLSNDLILCLEKHETEAEVINIIPSEKLIPANQLNKSYCCNKKFKVVKQCTNEVHLIAKAKCGSFRWDDDLWFPLTITQDQQQPVPPSIHIGNVTGPATIIAASTVTGSAVASSDTNIQRNISSNRTTNVTGSTIVSGVNQTNSALLSSNINQQQNPDVNQQQNSDVNQQQNSDVNQQQNSSQKNVKN